MHNPKTTPTAPGASATPDVDPQVASVSDDGIPSTTHPSADDAHAHSAKDAPSTNLTVALLDPALIEVDSTYNRDADDEDSEESEALRGSILETGGNTQPITVRPLDKHEIKPNQPFRFRLISGLRRHTACAELGLKVLAVIRQQPASADTLLDRLIENHMRKNLKPMEFGRQVQNLLDKRKDLNVRRLGKVLGCDHTLVSKAKSLAALPMEVLRCFGSESEIGYREGDDLKKALQKAPNEVLLEAERIADERKAAGGAPLTPTEVVKRLKKAAGLDKKQDQDDGEPFTTVLAANGSPYGEITLGRKGELDIRLNLPLTPKLRAALEKQLRQFVERKVLAGEPSSATTKTQLDTGPQDAARSHNGGNGQQDNAA